MEADIESVEKLADLFSGKEKRKIGDTTGRYMSDEEFEEIIDYINQKVMENQK